MVSCVNKGGRYYLGKPVLNGQVLRCFPKDVTEGPSLVCRVRKFQNLGA